MRFLNTAAFVERGVLEIQYVADYELDDETNAYAILSHRWGDDEDEVTYNDIVSKSYHDKPGSRKLAKFCEIAASFGCRYGWADTCCIDKTNSSELTEAINSMFRWYRDSKVCIAYLRDVPDKPMIEDEWFTRGWTLQELIAPRNVQFYDRDWASLGTKSEKLTDLEAIHRIPSSVLRDSKKLSECSVAQRMSWASSRQTKREEDQAYALMGILDVNMPTIYGEGKRAFLRLQQAIMQQTKDETLFAWEMEHSEPDDDTSYSGLFAPSPKAYANCSDVVMAGASRGFSEANGEISIRLTASARGMETFCVILHCKKSSGLDIGIFVRRTSLEDDDEYVRVTNKVRGGRVEISSFSHREGSERLVRVPIRPRSAPVNIFNGFWLCSLTPPGHDQCTRHTLSRQPGLDEDLIGIDGGPDCGRTAGIIYYRPKQTQKLLNTYPGGGWSEIRWIKLGFDQNFNPMLYLANDLSGYPMIPSFISAAKPKGSLFDKVLNGELRSSYSLEQLLTDKWMTTPGFLPSRTYGWRDGVTVIRFDRKLDLLAILDGLNLRIRLRLTPWHKLPPSICQKFETNGLSVWTLVLTGLGSDDPETSYIENEKVIQGRALQVKCEKCCGCDYTVAENDLQDSQNKKAAHLSDCRIINVTDLDSVITLQRGSENVLGYL